MQVNTTRRELIAMHAGTPDDNSLDCYALFLRCRKLFTNLHKAVLPSHAWKLEVYLEHVALVTSERQLRCRSSTQLGGKLDHWMRAVPLRVEIMLTRLNHRLLQWVSSIHLSSLSMFISGYSSPSRSSVSITIVSRGSARRRQL